MKLSPESKRTFDRITAKYVLSADGLLALEGALQNYDDYQRARARVSKDGIVGKDGRRHPAHDIAVNCYRNFLAGLRYLGLDASPDGDPEMNA